MNTKKEEFYKFVDVQGEDECWEWRGCKNKTGQGIFNWRGTWVSVAWLSWVFTHTGSTKGMTVHRSCNNKLCVNPTHLFLEKSTYRRLTGKDAINIRELWRDKNTTLEKLADLFGVSASTIRSVLSYDTWKEYVPAGKPVVYPKK